MAINLANLACETSSAPGTATTINLAGAIPGRTAIGLDFATGQSGYWALDDGTQQEISYGAYTAGSPNTIARTTVLWNSSSGHTAPSRLNFATVTNVYPWAPSRRILYVDAAGYADLKGYPLGVYGMQVHRGYLHGMELTRASNTTLTAAVGVCADAANYNGYITFQAQKTLNFGTTGAGGLDTGSFTAGNTYHVFAIGQADGTSALFSSLSLTPTLPGSYVFRRRIGSVLSLTGPVLFSWVQFGDQFWLTTPFSEYEDVPAEATPYTLTLARAPNGIIVQMMLHASFQQGAEIYAPTRSYNTVSLDGTTIGGNVSGDLSCPVSTNTSKQIIYFVDAGYLTLWILNRGWIDRRGRDN